MQDDVQESIAKTLWYEKKGNPSNLNAQNAELNFVSTVEGFDTAGKNAQTQVTKNTLNEQKGKMCSSVLGANLESSELKGVTT